MTDNETILGLEDDAEGTRIVAEEQRLLKVVLTALESAERSRANETQDDALLLELRDDVAAAKPEDLPALLEQMHNLGSLRAQRGKGVTGALDRGSPYFGHLRLEETWPNEKTPRRRDVLVGARSFVDAKAGLRVVDWRNAPVSRLFYRYRENDDYEEVLGDRPVEGVIVARRSVAIVDGSLRRVSSPQGTYVLEPSGRWRKLEAASSKLSTAGKADGKARLGLGADGNLRQDKVLPAIAAMLDKEQYDLITKPSTGVVAIQGSAGSGKTTVGLHRVAYLHSTAPNRFRADRMLVVVPNDALIHYVGRVLPDLGVANVPITTFARFALRAVLGAFPKLPTATSDETPISASVIKSHGRMLRAVDALVAAQEKLVAERIERGMAKWQDGARVVAAAKACGLWAAQSGSTLGEALDGRLAALVAWLNGKPVPEGLTSIDRPALASATAAGLPESTRNAAQSLLNDVRAKVRNVTGHWEDLLTDREAMAAAFEGASDVTRGQLEQAHEWNLRQSRIRSEGERDGDKPSLDAEDHSILLRLWQRLRGPLLGADDRPLRLAHLFVDEVQDASPVELRVLLDMVGKERSVTLAGDFAQRMLEDGDTRGEFHWSHMLSELGLPAASLEPLKVSYRSTGPITRFARGVLGPYAHEAEPVTTRSGPPVEMFAFAGIGEAVAFLADALKELAASEPSANVAIVARFPQQADIYYEGLERAEVANVRRVAKQNFTWERGVEVTDVRQTKGLEFDEVVLVETTATSYPDTANARHALYVGATRAAHQLWCVAGDKPSPVVAEALEAAAAAEGDTP